MKDYCLGALVTVVTVSEQIVSLTAIPYGHAISISGIGPSSAAWVRMFPVCRLLFAELRVQHP